MQTFSILTLLWSSLNYMIQNHGTNMAFVQLKSIYYEAGTQRAQNVQPKGQTME